MASVRDVTATPWRAASSLTGIARTAALIVPVALPLIVTPWGTDAYSHVKALLLYALAGIAAAAWVTARLIARPPWRATAPELPAWLFLLAVMIGTASSVDPRLSVFGAPGRYEGLFVLAAYVMLYMVGVHLFGSRGGVDALLGATAVASVAVVGYGLLQPFVPPLFAGEAFLRDWYGRGSLPRISSTVGGPVLFGGYVAFVLPILFARAAGRNAGRRLLWLAAGAMAVIALALTLTRAAWLGAGVGLIVFWVGSVRVTAGRRAVAAALGVALIAAAAALLIGLGRPGQVGSRVVSTVNVEAGSVAQRIYTWSRTLALIRARPIFGWGPETLGEVFPYERPSLVRYFGLRPVIINRAHNDVLHIAVSIGIPGAAAYVVFWILVLATAHRRWVTGGDRIIAAGWAGALVAYLIQAQFSFSTAAVTPIVWLLAGAVSGWTVQPETEP